MLQDNAIILLSIHASGFKSQVYDQTLFLFLDIIKDVNLRCRLIEKSLNVFLQFYLIHGSASNNTYVISKRFYNSEKCLNPP